MLAALRAAAVLEPACWRAAASLSSVPGSAATSSATCQPPQAVHGGAPAVGHQQRQLSCLAVTAANWRQLHGLQQHTGGSCNATGSIGIAGGSRRGLSMLASLSPGQRKYRKRRARGGGDKLAGRGENGQKSRSGVQTSLLPRAHCKLQSCVQLQHNKT